MREEVRKVGVFLLLSQVLFCLSHCVLGMLARTSSGPMPIGRRECVLYALNAGMRQWGSYGAGTVTTRLQKKKGLALDEFQSQSLAEMSLSV